VGGGWECEKDRKGPWDLLASLVRKDLEESDELRGTAVRPDLLKDPENGEENQTKERGQGGQERYLV